MELRDSDRDLIVAIHEAGHAVACCRLGVPFAQVSIACGGGGVETEAICRPCDAEDLERYAGRCGAQVVIAFAGPIAEMRAACCGLTLALGFSSGRKDERDARYFVREMIEAKSEIALKRNERAVRREDLPSLLVAELRRLHGQAEALVEAEFAAIEAVARRLAEERQLTAHEVARCVG